MFPYCGFFGPDKTESRPGEVIRVTFLSDGETPGSGARCSARCVTVLSPNPGPDCCSWCPQCECCSSQGVEGSGGGLEEQLGSGEGSGSGEDSTEDKPSPPPVIKLLTKLLKNLFYIFS